MWFGETISRPCVIGSRLTTQWRLDSGVCPTRTAWLPDRRRLGSPGSAIPGVAAPSFLVCPAWGKDQPISERSQRTEKRTPSEQQAFFSLKPRLLRCAGPNQARALHTNESDRSEIEWTIALATTVSQVVREPFFPARTESTGRTAGQANRDEPNDMVTSLGEAGIMPLRNSPLPV